MTIPCSFVTFGDSKFQRALNRIKSEAETFGFSSISCLTPNDLDPQFYIRHKNFIEKNPRGFGFYIWKPQVILQTLRKLPKDSFLLYSDAGCTINKEGRQRFLEYIEIANHNNIFCFHMDYKECWWTKMDVLKKLQFDSEEDFKSKHCVATTHVWKNSKFSIDFLMLFLNLCEDYKNINDDPSIIPNHPEFKEHRGDQSIFSILIKKSNIKTYQDETWWGTNWDNNLQYPIHARRIRG
jgi:hypothetical protein